MDCFFHNAVPSVAPCRGCKKPVCASCRNENGDCPGCVLAARIDAARQTNVINGGVGPSSGTYAGASPGPTYSAPEPPPPTPPRVPRTTALAEVRPETRALVALGYPFVPLAVIALLDSKASLAVKRQAWQAVGFNVGMCGFSAVLGFTALLPILQFSAWPLLPFIVPLWMVASVVYGYKVWQGEDVDVPLVSDWVDARLSPTPHGGGERTA
jgi:hypothetical protein